jgi:polyvinyl alcohol dehydrogenase (cytochrome)
MSLNKIFPALFAVILPACAASDGALVYKQNCAACHDAGLARVPQKAVLSTLAPDSIVKALVSGAMRFQGVLLSADEKKAVAEFLTGKSLDLPKTEVGNVCTQKPVNLSADGPSWNGWGLDESNTRFQSASEAGLTAASVPKLKLKWAFGFPGDFVAYSQPVVFGGRVFVGSASGAVYSLDAKTGCTYWSYEGLAGVRAAITISPLEGSGYAAYVGDQQGNVYALDASIGKLIWKVRADEHPAARITGSPHLYKGVLYVPVASGEEWTSADPRYECCTFRGSVVALDSKSGKQIWKSYTIPEEPKKTRTNKIGTQLWGPSGASVWGSPTIDAKRNTLYVGTGDDYSEPAARTSDAILAFDLTTGKLLWSRQLTENDIFNTNCIQANQASCPTTPGPDHDFGSSPVLRNLPKGKRAIIAAQKSGLVHALDPDEEGEVIWQEKIGKGGLLGGIQWGVAADDNNVYAPLSDLVLHITDVSKLQASAGFQPSPTAGGGLFALRLKDGKKVWAAPPPAKACGTPGCSPAQSAAATLIPGVVFSGSLDGHLRAYSTADGSVLWDYDSARDYKTVNGVPARGGGIDGPGPAIAGGMLYVNSGYGLFNGMPGNVLLAFGAE